MANLLFDQVKVWFEEHIHITNKNKIKINKEKPKKKKKKKAKKQKLDLNSIRVWSSDKSTISLTNLIIYHHIYAYYLGKLEIY